MRRSSPSAACYRLLLALAFVFLLTEQLAAQQLRSLETWGQVNLHTPHSLEDNLEKIAGKIPRWLTVSSLLKEDPGWRKLVDPVGRLDIKYSNGWFNCTGFFISSSLIMTNAHCAKHDGKYPNQVIMRMNYLDEANPAQWKNINLESVPVEYELDRRKALDYAIFRVQAPAKNEWGTLALLPSSFKPGQGLIVVQHPEGSTKKVVMDQNGCYATKPLAVVDLMLVHECDTLGGSSGSPVLDAKNRSVVALHFAGAIIPGGVRNFASPIAQIAAASKIVASLTATAGQPKDKPDTNATSTAIIQWCQEAAPNNPWFNATCQDAFSNKRLSALNLLIEAIGWQSREHYQGPILKVSASVQCFITGVEADYLQRKGKSWVWGFGWSSSDGKLHDCPYEPSYYASRLDEMRKSP